MLFFYVGWISFVTWKSEIVGKQPQGRDTTQTQQMLQHHSCIAKEGRLLMCGIRVHYPYDTAPIHPPPARQTQ